MERHRRVNSARGDSLKSTSWRLPTNKPRYSYSKCVFGPAEQLVASRIAFYLLVADMWHVMIWIRAIIKRRGVEGTRNKGISLSTSDGRYFLDGQLKNIQPF